MMNWWPFVSRARFEDQRAELERVRAELRHAVERSEKLWNVMLFRMGGVIVDVDTLPLPYQPRAAEAARAKTEGAKPKQVIMPRDVRTRLVQFEENQETEYMRQAGLSHKISAEQAAVVSELNQAANEAVKEAKAG
jgi:hypothetical protein